MVKPFKLTWPIGRADAMDKDDIENTKQALDALGLYEPPELFTERFSTEPMIRGLKKFQRQEGLVPDGVMSPDGPTHRRMNEVLEDISKPENARDMNIPKAQVSADLPNPIPHSTAIRLYSPVGHRRDNHPHDIVSVKRGLAMLGEFPMHRSSIDDTQADDAFFETLRRFQKSSGVKVDGWMGPKGETENALEERIQALAKPGSSNRAGGVLDDNPNNTTETAAAHIPPIVFKMAEVFGMAVMAAWAWWQSMSSTEQETLQQSIVNSHANDDRESLCDDLLYNIDTPMCNAVSKKRGKAAGAKCRASASARYSACLRGTPIDQLPPLNVCDH